MWTAQEIKAIKHDNINDLYDFRDGEWVCRINFVTK